MMDARAGGPSDRGPAPDGAPEASAKDPDRAPPHLEEGVPGPVTPGPAAKVGWVRRMYDWVLSFANRPSGPWALAGFSFAESSFFPIPPDPLLVALSIGAPKKAFRFATVCAIASVLGGIAGYGIGWGVWEAVDQLFYAWVPGVTPEAFAEIRVVYDRYDFWAIFAAGFTPIPFKVFTLSAGAFEISFAIFVVASTVSRSARFFLVAGLIYVYGPSIQGFIDRYFDLLAWLFLVLLVAGFIVVKVFLG